MVCRTAREIGNQNPGGSTFFFFIMSLTGNNVQWIKSPVWRSWDNSDENTAKLSASHSAVQSKRSPTCQLMSAKAHSALPDRVFACRSRRGALKQIGGVWRKVYTVSERRRTCGGSRVNLPRMQQGWCHAQSTLSHETKRCWALYSILLWGLRHLLSLKRKYLSYSDRDTPVLHNCEFRFKIIATFGKVQTSSVRLTSIAAHLVCSNDNSVLVYNRRHLPLHCIGKHGDVAMSWLSPNSPPRALLVLSGDSRSLGTAGGLCRQRSRSAAGAHSASQEANGMSACAFITCLDVLDKGTDSGLT